MKCFWILGHDWSLWEDVKLRKILYDFFMGTYEGTRFSEGQQRTCKKCGKKQVRELKC